MSGVEVNAWGAVRNWRTWYLALINLCDSTVKYAIIYWCPLIIYHMVGENMPHATGEAVVPHDALVALLTALPFGFAAVFMLVNARHSAATGQHEAQTCCNGVHLHAVTMERWCGWTALLAFVLLRRARQRAEHDRLVPVTYCLPLCRRDFSLQSV